MTTSSRFRLKIMAGMCGRYLNHRIPLYDLKQLPPFELPHFTLLFTLLLPLRTRKPLADFPLDCRAAKRPKVECTPRKQADYVNLCYLTIATNISRVSILIACVGSTG